MENEDVRWKQRFQNFEKAFLFFNSAIEKESYTPIEVGGLVKAFEFTFELGWKTIKDFLYLQGLSTNYPREVIKEAFQTKIVDDGHTWLHMLEKRNELSHTYLIMKPLPNKRSMRSKTGIILPLARYINFLRAK